MIVVETNVISEIMKPEPDARVVEWFQISDEPMALTAMTLSASYAGIMILPSSRRQSRLLKAFRDTTSGRKSCHSTPQPPGNICGGAGVESCLLSQRAFAFGLQKLFHFAHLSGLDVDHLLG